MKKTIILYLLMATCAFAEVSTTDINRNMVEPTSRLVTSLRTWFDQVNTDVANAGTNLGTGKVFYVDSGVGSDTYDGTKPEWAKATGNGAVALCEDNRGDTIYFLQGHNEALTSADGFDIDVAGVTVIGIGNGSLKPTFDYDNAAGEIVIGAANVTIKNIRCRVSANATIKAIDIETAGNYATISGCDFGWAETATDEFASAIIVAANDVTVENCVFRGGGQAAVSAISVPAAQDNLMIRGNLIHGDYSTACISAVGVITESMIIGNIIFNGTMGGDGELNTEPAIEVADTSSGFVADNRIVSDVATALLMRVADDMVFMNNFVSDTDGDEFSGTTEDTGASVTAHTDG